MEFDGKKQRNALTAAENALRALADGQASRALANASRASDLDQLGVYSAFAAAVERIAADTPPGDDEWDEIVDSLEPGPLTFLVEELRG